MFSRKKPPQLTTIEELQQTYDDCCNLSIKYITLEEKNQIEEALKGWKSLHTSLLYKLEVFEKQSYKFNNNELVMLSELKGIRDENVKHLIRVQMRVDEASRRRVVPSNSTSNSSGTSRPSYSTKVVGSSMSVPSLRNNSARSSLQSPSNSRQMLKSLRPTPSSSLSKSNNQQASKAANLSWPKPAPKKAAKPEKSTESLLFDDFDQNSFDFGQNWEKVNSRTSSGISAISAPEEYEPSLIDLDQKGPNSYIYSPQNEHYQSNDDVLLDYFASDQDSTKSPTVSHGFEDLSVKTKPPPVPKVPPPPPPPRTKVQDHGSTATIRVVPSPKTAPPAANVSSNISKSAPDIPKAAAEVKYSYTKPKPMNISAMMKQSQKPKVATAARPKATAPKLKSSGNISYNYVKATSAKTQSPTRKAKPVVKKTSPRPENKAEIKPENGTKNGNSSPPNEPEPTLENEEKQLISSIKGIDPIAAKQILNDIVVKGDEVYWDDIVGLEGAKNSLKEAVVYPFLRPDLFRGLREPTRGMLLFGPPGTGKTMLARAVATESKSTFFSISASSLTSKYLGESEKLVRALFLLAKKLAPSIVFVDEIDSLLSSRTEGEVESSRRIKNEFLVQWSELSSAAAGRDAAEDTSRVLILGATNLPWSIDEAARRRFVRRQYIPLPEDETRSNQIRKLLKYQKNTLSDEDYNKLIELTKGFSGSDITALAKDSAMGPLRSLGDALLSTATENIRPINLDDFINSLKYIRPSVSTEGLEEYENWALKFGSSGA